MQCVRVDGRLMCVRMSIYSFKLKSVFDTCLFLADRRVLWLNDTPRANLSEEVNRKCP